MWPVQPDLAHWDSVLEPTLVHQNRRLAHPLQLPLVGFCIEWEGASCFHVYFLLCSYVIHYRLHLLLGIENVNMV